MSERFDVIVVGGGHAGCEAALAASRVGCSVLLLDHDVDNAALMPCNPSIGGPAKGHIVRELDALGGEQGIAADSSAIQMRWLNTSKGPALRALRAQCDMRAYARHYASALFGTSGLRVYQSMADDLLIEGGKVGGVVTMAGERFESSRVVLACGTYLRGTVHIGESSFSSGPIGHVASTKLSESLAKNGIWLGRFRTDTTPRIDSATVDWASLTLQMSDDEPEGFSNWMPKKVYTGSFCGLTRTNERTHEILRESLDRSPLATDRLMSKGPRYCPSIDDKVMRFPDRSSHPIFLEPTGVGREIYMQNFSTSMPPDVQLRMIRTLPGCERAVMIKPGYAIEYDRIDPRRLEPWLESVDISGLYFAGQICGTSGYEEAACLGFMAGVNAALASKGLEPLVLRRDEAYIGVLIDDITTRGVDEPYRMLPSRCEHRLVMRHDNADDRLCGVGREIGTIDDERWRVVERRRRELRDERARLEHISIKPSSEASEILVRLGSSPLEAPTPALSLLARPEVSWEEVARLTGSTLDAELGRKIEIEIKYAGYAERERRHAERAASMGMLKIPNDIDYGSMPGLSAEAVDKLTASQPRTLGSAARIPGINMVEIELIQITIERMRGRRDACAD